MNSRYLGVKNKSCYPHEKFWFNDKNSCSQVNLCVYFSKIVFSERSETFLTKFHNKFMKDSLRMALITARAILRGNPTPALGPTLFYEICIYKALKNSFKKRAARREIA